MPTPYIKKLSKEGKGSVKTLEKKWDKAKDVAKKEGKPKNYGLITHIFKKMSHASTKPIKIEAAQRLKADMEPEEDVSELGNLSV